MASVRPKSELNVLFSNAALVAQNTVSAELDLREMRYHIFQLIGPEVTDSVRLEVSADAVNWCELAIMKGVNVLARFSGLVPHVRAVRLDAPADADDKILLQSYSCREDQYFP